MTNTDEPLFDLDSEPEAARESDLTVRERVRSLAEEQDYGVLCVQGGGQPYGALVAFAFSEDMRHITFATPTAKGTFLSSDASSRGESPRFLS